ncbi:MAG: class I SAM-dependent rRNA methyltransferase [Anaerolineales bacterium]
MLEIDLKPGREKALLHNHPWLFSGSIANVKGEKDELTPGQTCRIVDSKGEFVAWGAFSPVSKIRVRVWSRDPAVIIDRNFLQVRLENAIRLRRRILDSGTTNACRLVHAESDGLPGLIVDKYGDTLVVQFLSAGPEYWQETISDLLEKITGTKKIFERSDADVRRLEGLSSRVGSVTDVEPPKRIKIFEGKNKFWVDISSGQKTGFYLDQRDNRKIIQDLAVGHSVLDCFAYTGGFSIPALMGGAASVVAIESSSDSIGLGRENVILNNLPEEKIEWIEGDVFQQLRAFRDQNRKFDLVILDPPKFAPTSAHAQRAARGYKDINLLGMKLLNQGGLLITFSCSGGVSENLFQKILAGAAQDAGVEARILTRLGPGCDHPVALNFPEGAYLKGFVIQV